MNKDNKTPRHFFGEHGAEWIRSAPNTKKPYHVYERGSEVPYAATEAEAAEAYAKSQPPKAPDWIAEGIAADAEGMEESANETAGKKATDETTDAPPTDPLREVTATDLLRRKVESIPCLIEPIFQAVGLAAVAGSSDVGKSAFLRQLAFSVGTGEADFLGWPIRAKHRSAIYVSTEDDENATAFLLCMLNKAQQKNPSDCQGLRFIFDTHDLLNELDRRLTNAPADLVVIDAFGDLYGGDANKTNQIRQFLHGYSQLAQKHGCLVLWLHHTGKRTDDEAPSKHNVIGGQGFEGKMRLLIELRRDHHDQSRRHLCIVKGNYLPDEFKGDSYALGFESFQFTQTAERIPFEQLMKPKDDTDVGREKYEEIQRLRGLGLKGDVLAQHAGMSKGYISKLEAKYGPKEEMETEVSSQFPTGNSR
ncbi:AAA family ATPase [Fibrella sp. HMF5335]|uniref:AAA family ATPase n=1 Tax=Fibrella rubiginis TaxID=2817060 RepID=A0A939GI25_9BACT|nr:AAA family ATPase [Fibrella rubiginis]MBO0937865.1 AAA family ATPase [Fibrella rubiginis]